MFCFMLYIQAPLLSKTKADVAGATVPIPWVMAMVISLSADWGEG